MLKQIGNWMDRLLLLFEYLFSDFFYALFIKSFSNQCKEHCNYLFIKCLPDLDNLLNKSNAKITSKAAVMHK